MEEKRAFNRCLSHVSLKRQQQLIVEEQQSQYMKTIAFLSLHFRAGNKQNSAVFVVEKTE